MRNFIIAQPEINFLGVKICLKTTNQDQQEIDNSEEINRREALKRLGKLAYTAPTVTLISLNARAGDGPNPPPPPPSGSPLQQWHPKKSG